jgi:glycosyltransferase involved in cell wall biosynthesis
MTMDTESDTDCPKASLIVPTLNRAWLFARLLPLLAEQEVGVPYEVIVVDNGSRDETPQLIREASRRWPHVRLIEEQRPGAGLARHAGAAAARSPLLIFIDDDMRPEPGVVAEHLRMHAEGGRDVCVLGNVISAPSSHPFERMLAYIYDGSRMTLPRREPTAEDCWSGHMSLPRELYFRLGGFDETFAALGGEDLEFGLRMLAAGVRLRFAESALTHHHFTARFGDALRRWYRNGLAFGYIISQHPGLAISGVRPAGAGWRSRAIQAACRLSAAVLEPFSRGRGVPFVPLTFVYSLGLRTAIGRGLRDYLQGKKPACLNSRLQS